MTTALLANAVVAQNIVFQDNFNISDTTSESVLTSPTLLSGRGTGYRQDTIQYRFEGGISATGGTVSGVSVSDQKLAFSLPTDGYVRFLDVSINDDVDFAPIVGDHYEVSYKAYGTFNQPLTFSISSEKQAGRYNADQYAEYDFALRSWTNDWVVGEDGVNLYDGNSVTDSFDATAGTEYSVRIVFDERVDDASTVGITEAEASIYIDNALLDTYDIEFETDARYMQFAARTSYADTLDDLTITSFAVPELSNTTFIFSLFALSICLSRRGFYSLRA